MSKRQGIMLCYPFEEKRLAKWSPPYIVDPKLDGERARPVPTKVPFLPRPLLSSELNPFNFAVPHIIKAIEEQIPPKLEVDGELYRHGMSFEEIHSIVSRSKNLHQDHLSMEYHIFDVVTEDPQYERIAMVRQLELKPPLFKVERFFCETFDEVMRAYDMILEQGYEGIVVRHIDNLYVRKRSTFMMKFKPKKEDNYTILGYKEEISKDGQPKGRLGALVCAGSDGTVFSVGSGLNQEDRIHLWEVKDTLRGKTCTVKYQHITPGKGVPRFPVFVEVREKFVNPLLTMED